MLVVGLFFTSCSRGQTSDLNDTEGNVHVSIQTQIPLDVSGLPHTATRAETGAVTDIDVPTESSDDGLHLERMVRKVRVMVFNGEKIIKNRLFYPKSTDIPARAGNTALPKSTLPDATYQSSSTADMRMDMEIPPGDYEFVLVANELTDMHLEMLETRTQLSEGGTEIKTTDLDNPILTIEKLREYNDRPRAQGQYLIMTGSAYFRVAAGKGTKAKPQVLAPNIDLIRVVAKVQLNLTNRISDTDDNVHPNAKYTKIKKVELINANKKFNLMSPSFPVESLVQTSPTPDADGNNYIKKIEHNSGDKYKKSDPLVFYMTERRGVQENNATAIRITVDNDYTERVYTIPLYRTVNGRKYYDIYRNTIYRISARLVGPELRFDVPLLVAPWSEATPVNIHVLEDDSYE